MSDEPPLSRRAAREAAAAGRRRGRDRAAEPGTELATVAVGADAAEAPGAEAAEGETAGGEQGGGILGSIRRHPVTWLVSAIVVAFVGLGTGAVFTGVAVASGREDPAPVESDEPVPPRPLPEEIVAASALRTCSVDDAASDERLSRLHASVVLLDSAGAQSLLNRRAGTPVRAGSVMKAYTAAAAIAVLGPEYRITTSVVEGGVPGSVVLVGRGDATLSALPAGQESVYRGAPKLAELAAQTIAAYSSRNPDVPLTQIVLDSSYWDPGDDWQDGWPSGARSDGYQSRVTALQVDGDRADPRAATSRRSDDPVARAGELFLDALRAADPGGIVGPEVATTRGSASEEATLLGEVQSQPVSTLVDQMLVTSDNTLAEMLARVTSKRSGLDGSSGSLQNAIPSAIATFDVSIEDMRVVDGSGLSRDAELRMRGVADFMGAVWEGRRGLDLVRSGLSVAGESGALRERFSGDASDARGRVTAIPGALSTAHSLAGIVEAEDGALLAFSVSAVRDGIGSDARQAIDELVAGFSRCGSNLANF